MTVREKRTLKKMARRWYRRAIKGLFEASIILTISMGTALCFWCSI